MRSPLVTSKEWLFTRPDPLNSDHQFFRADLRQIAGQQDDYDLPWRDDMYLSYPSPEAPDWPAFVEHVRELNARADTNTQYKIVYIMRRAHKARQDNGVPDPPLDDLGKRQCSRLVANFERAMQTVGLPPPELVVTSPLARALETTELGILPLFPPVRSIVLENMREAVTGVGKNVRHDKTWIQRNFPTFNLDHVEDVDELSMKYNSADHKEPYEAVWQRMRGALAHVFDTYPEASVVLLMSHCYAQQTMQREISGWDVPEEDRKEAVEFFVGEAGGYAMLIKGARS